MFTRDHNHLLPGWGFSFCKPLAKLLSAPPFPYSYEEILRSLVGGDAQHHSLREDSNVPWITLQQMCNKASFLPDSH